MIDDSDVMTLTIDRTNAADRVRHRLQRHLPLRPTAPAKWTKVRGIPSSSRRTRAFAQSPDNQNLLFAGTIEGLWMSEDGGTTWRLATQKDLVVNSVVALPGGIVLLGTDGAGVVRSADGGPTWVASNAGFSERFVSRMVFDRVGRRVLAGIWGDRRHGGVFAARDAARAVDALRHRARGPRGALPRPASAARCSPAPTTASSSPRVRPAPGRA